MSKSLGNFYTLRDLLAKGYTGQQVRYALLQAHYRTQLNFTFEGLEAAKASLQRILNCKLRLEEVQDDIDGGDVEHVMQTLKEQCVEALCDDLNISMALSHLFDVIRELHGFCDSKRISKKEAAYALSVLHDLDRVFGLFPLTPKDEIPVELLQVLESREQARNQKAWKEADRYRDIILAQGYRIEDAPTGPKLHKV